MNLRAHTFAVFSVALLTCACGGEDSGGELGAPCVEDADCADDLTCDIHDDRGSCQKPHGH